MLAKPQRLHVDRRRSGARERRVWDAEVAESMLILFLLRRQEARVRQQQQEQQRHHQQQLIQQHQQQHPQLHLPDVIATGPGRTVWKRSPHQLHLTHIVYQDAEAPKRLLHVIPDDHDSDDHCPKETLPQESSQPTDSRQPDMTKGLRCPARLGYVGMPLPVAPSFVPSQRQQQGQKKKPQPQYLVRPRFPMVVKTGMAPCAGTSLSSQLAS